MTEKEIKTYRIVYFSTAALFLVIFMMTGRLIYVKTGMYANRQYLYG